MSEIHVKEGESLDSALKRFKRSCAKAGIVAEVRRRECYESPSVKRRKKSEAARKNRINVKNPPPDRVAVFLQIEESKPFCRLAAERSRICFTIIPAVPRRCPPPPAA